MGRNTRKRMAERVAENNWEDGQSCWVVWISMITCVYINGVCLCSNEGQYACSKEVQIV